MELINLSAAFPDVCRKYFRHEIYCTPEIENILRLAVDEADGVTMRIMVNTLLFQLSRPDTVQRYEAGEMAIIKTRLCMPDSMTIQARVGPKSGTDATAIITIRVAHPDEHPSDNIACHSGDTVSAGMVVNQVDITPRHFRQVGAMQMSQVEIMEESLHDYWRHHQSNVPNVQKADCKTSASTSAVGIHGAKTGVVSDPGK